MLHRLLLQGMAVALCGLLLTAPAPACELRVRWSDDPPYLMRSERGEITGLQAELVSATAQRMGCQLRWVELPWARALIELQAGRLDLLAGGLRRPEREAYAEFVAQRFVSPNRLYVAVKQRSALDGSGRLDQVLGSGLRLGVQIGVVYGPDYVRLLEQPAFRRLLTQAASRRALWQMLAIGRVDGVLASEVSARWELAQLGLAERIVPTDVVVSDEQAFMMLSKRSVPPELVQRYRQASEALEKDGTQGRIVARYFGG